MNEIKKNVLTTNLFSGRTNGNITLSDSVMNYDFIEVVYCGNSNYVQAQSVKLDTKDLPSAGTELQVQELSSTHLIVRSSIYSISTNQMNRISYRYLAMNGSEFNNSVAGPYLYILSVNGYKVIAK